MNALVGVTYFHQTMPYKTNPYNLCTCFPPTHKSPQNSPIALTLPGVNTGTPNTRYLSSALQTQLYSGYHSLSTCYFIDQADVAVQLHTWYTRQAEFRQTSSHPHKLLVIWMERRNMMIMIMIMMIVILFKLPC